MPQLPIEILAEILKHLPIRQRPWDRRSRQVLQDPLVVVSRYLIAKSEKHETYESTWSFLDKQLDLDHPRALGAVIKLAKSPYSDNDRIFLKCQREERCLLANVMVNANPDLICRFYVDAGTATGRELVEKFAGESNVGPIYGGYTSYFYWACDKRWERAALACLEIESPHPHLALELFASAVSSGYVSVFTRLRSALPNVLFSLTNQGALYGKVAGTEFGSLNMFIFLLHEADLDVFGFELHGWREAGEIIRFLCERDIGIPQQTIHNLLYQSILYGADEICFEDLQRVVSHYHVDINQHVVEYQAELESMYDTGTIDLHNAAIVSWLLLGADARLLTPINVERLKVANQVK